MWRPLKTLWKAIHSKCWTFIRAVVFDTGCSAFFCRVLWECFVLSQGDGVEGSDFSLSIGIRKCWKYKMHLACLAVTLCTVGWSRMWCIQSGFGKRNFLEGYVVNKCWNSSCNESDCVLVLLSRSHFTLKWKERSFAYRCLIFLKDCSLINLTILLQFQITVFYVIIF